MRYRTHLLILFTGAMALVTQKAAASSDYPDLIKNKFGLARAPDCTLCHSDDNGGNGTIVKWFGLTMQDLGVQGKRPDLLDAALDRDRDDEIDSDADGIPDVEELQSGTDPNDGPGRTGGPPRPERGCAISPREPGDLGSGLLIALAWSAKRASAWSRRRRDRGFRKCRESAKDRSTP
jgi:hypothetical protein